ncbi:MAG: sulfurtransferase [Bacteroidia bacterium]|jgi:thiosulfate/3-mercaptopyruvate sulfurtransferase
MYPLLSPNDLLKINHHPDLILVDAGNRAFYDQHHLMGAVFVDLNTQLADIKSNAADGGRHPLPTPQSFVETVGHLGISSHSHVVVYDDKNASNAAARLWWMLRAIGLEKVQVLDGGFQAAEKIGYPIDAQLVIPKPVAPIPVDDWKLPLSDISEVERVSHDAVYVIIDVRDSDRYKGLTEPIDTIAGHIPGAVNIPFTGNLDLEGNFLPAEKLREKYKLVFDKKKPDQIIVHCGSGVTACHTLLAMAAAGYDIPKLYVGSWSEWSRNNKPMVLKSQTP